MNHLNYVILELSGDIANKLIGYYVDIIKRKEICQFA
jgi:hypothetical protein